jgi:hypothetical protein
MLRLALCTVIAVVTFPVAVFADDLVPQFEALVKRGSQLPPEAISRVTFVEKSNSWIRTTTAIQNVKYDVRKTDSLVNPTIGIVSFQLIRRGTGLVASKEAAEAAEFNPRLITHDAELRYSYRGGRWVFHEGWFTSRTTGSERFAITPERELRNPLSPYRAWLE